MSNEIWNEWGEERRREDGAQRINKRCDEHVGIMSIDEYEQCTRTKRLIAKSPFVRAVSNVVFNTRSNLRETSTNVVYFLGSGILDMIKTSLYWLVPSGILLCISSPILSPLYKVISFLMSATTANQFNKRKDVIDKERETQLSTLN